MPRLISGCLFTLVHLIALMCFSFAEQTRQIAPRDIETAVKAMRRVKQVTLSSEERKQKSDELDKAWATLEATGPAGLKALKDEIQRIEAGPEQDDVFKLGAAGPLFLGQGDVAIRIRQESTSAFRLSTS
jgi:hypothetical protein